jgi:hypothetical protein
MKTPKKAINDIGNGSNNERPIPIPKYIPSHINKWRM